MYLPYLSELGSYARRGSNICWIVQQNKWNKCLGLFKCWVPQLLNLINSNMVLCIKKNECILDIFLDMYIFLSEILLQLITYSIFVMLAVFPHGCAYAFVNEWSPYTFIKVLAYNHTIKLINTYASTCLSTLDKWTIGNKRRNLNKRWAHLNASSKFIYRK